MKISFLGLGHMGLPMARNLAAAGHDVVGFDVFPPAVDAARESGLTVAESATDAVQALSSSKGAEVVITMFQNGAQVIDAYLGAGGSGESGGSGGLLSVAPRDTLFIDCSTIAVDDAREVHRLAASAGHRALDAPVSGGVVGAENATLAFMVGGSKDDFEAGRPILEAMGRRVVHCGGAGLGQAAKVCNNMILAVSQIAVAEAFVLGERLGLDHQALFDVASHASGQCWALTTNCPVPGPVPTSPSNHDYQPGFAGALMNKDLGLAEQAIDLTGVDARMGRLARQIYQEFSDGEGARQDFSAIIHTIRAESAAA